MTFIAYIDVKSPYAYLALHEIEAIEDELGVEADWRHFTLDIPSYLGSAELDAAGTVLRSDRTEHQWKRVRYAYMDVRRRANPLGLTIRGTTKIWDSSAAGAAMLFAKRSGRAPMRRFLSDVYARFWRRELDIEDLDVLAERLSAAGVDPPEFRDWAREEGGALHDAQRAEAWEAGVFGVPTLSVDGELFFGAETFPLARARLQQRRN